MTVPSDDILHDFKSNEGARKDDMDRAEADLGFQLPTDYRAFLTRCNGGEGFVGKHYLIVWPVEKIAQFNREYQVDEYAPGIILFGSSGGGEGFGYDTRTKELPVVQVPFVGLDLRNAKTVARNFSDLLSKMRSLDGSLF